ncbi:hypothetical protein ACIG87_09930 [Micromonospora sp. NPDC051925]|uniref:hypothetical protein n=1 Tax=Micromonospora sp. NPDC051925 TaxID=3364288 RepID=UPI0037CC71F3
MVLILESRSHLDLGDLPNLLAAELGVMTVRLERAIRSLDGVARVHVNRWGDGSAHLHMWFLARPYGRLQLRGTFLSLWDSILPPISESQWRENLAHVAAWLAEFGGRPLAEPPRIQWQTPSSIAAQSSAEAAAAAAGEAVSVIESEEETPLPAPAETSTDAPNKAHPGPGTSDAHHAETSDAHDLDNDGHDTASGAAETRTGENHAHAGTGAAADRTDAEAGSETDRTDAHAGTGTTDPAGVGTDNQTDSETGVEDGDEGTAASDVGRR